MSWTRRFLFGNAEFAASEEHQEFQYRFLCIVILAGSLLTGLLVLGSLGAMNPIAPDHIRSMTLFTAGSLVFWWSLRGRKHWYLLVAWSYELFCLLEYTSALYYVSEDEFRIVWFLVNIPGVYLLLGQRAGWAVTVLTALGLVLANPQLPVPYSPNALATLVSSMIYLGLFFHYFSDRSLSYFVRMKESNQQLYQLAMSDPLTDILNARAFYETARQLIRLATRSGMPCAVLFVDLDHFKQINDAYGHAAGDQVLKAAASTIAINIRNSDVLGRVGGEEFALFLPNTDCAAAKQVAEKIRAALAAQPVVTDSSVTILVTASFGVSCSESVDLDLDTLLQQADQAMYQAKQSGRNRVACLAN